MPEKQLTSEMVSAGASCVANNIGQLKRGNINSGQFAERVWSVMEEVREPSVFRRRFPLNELSLISDYVDPACVHPDTPVSALVYETCETVKRMAEDLGRMESEKEKQRQRADRAALIVEQKIQLANRLSEELEEQRERAEEAEERERSIWESFRAEGDRADKAVSKVAELRRVIQEMVELGSDHMDTANETLVHYMDGSSEPARKSRASMTDRIEWLERGISAIANDCAGTESDDVAIRLNELLAGREPTAESEYMGINSHE